MSSFFIDKTDPHIAEILERLRRVNCNSQDLF